MTSVAHARSVCPHAEPSAASRTVRPRGRGVIAASNRVGTEAPWNIGHFYGTSYFCDPRGNFLSTGSRDKDELVVAEMNLEMIEEVRRTWQFFRDRRPETYEDLVKQLP